MPMRLGYNTNGFAHHRLTDAIEILAEIGYASVAITLDHDCLNPFAHDRDEQTLRVRDQLQARGMSCVIETGTRFLLDPRRKHWPTLISSKADDRARRLDFLKRSIDVAVILNAEAVSFWAGTKEPSMSDDDAMAFLVDGCRALTNHAAANGIHLAFEPEPGMFVDTMDRFASLMAAINHSSFGLTLDVGHVHCLNDGVPADQIREYASCLFNVHIEDMKRGFHDHLPFGEGEMDFASIMAALREIEYAGPVNVELSRHSHDAVNMARQSFEFLNCLAE